MRLLVCGGRHYADVDKLGAWLGAFHERRPVAVLIHGDAPGADRLAGAWAARNGVPVEAFPADWREYGPAAGAVRNGVMLRDGKPDRVVAFPGGKGTADMIRKARRAGVPVDVVE